jgi:hypothetical protein
MLNLSIGTLAVGARTGAVPRGGSTNIVQLLAVLAPAS